MVNFFELFNEQGPVYNQFSFMMIFIFIYHTIYYYAMTAKGCVEKPDFNYILLFIILHMVQVYGMKYFHANKKIYYAWGLMLVPSLLYLAYVKYQEKRSADEQLQYWRYMATVQQQNQAPPPPPEGQFPTYGIQKGQQDFQQPMMQQGGQPVININQPPQYTQQNTVSPQLEQYGYSADLNSQMHNSSAFSEFQTNNWDPFASPYTSL